MKTLSVTVSETDYEVFLRAAQAQQRSFDQLIRDAMRLYRQQKLESESALTDLPVLSRIYPISELPPRTNIYNEIFHKDV